MHFNHFNRLAMRIYYENLILNQNCSGLKEIEEQIVEETLKERHAETAPPRDPSHRPTPNPYTIADAKKHLLTETWHSCSLRGSGTV